MGAVFKARSPQGDIDAIKVLLRADTEKLARFEREKRLLESLDEGVGFVPLRGAGDSPTGPFLVMPFVAGGTLRDKLDKGKMPVEQTRRLGRELASIMAAAHQRGIVHRDL